MKFVISKEHFVQVIIMIIDTIWLYW